MLYRLLGRAGSGVTHVGLDRIVNSKYDKALFITNELSDKVILERLKSYQENTGKVIVNSIKVKEYPYGEMTDDMLILKLEEDVENGHDCVVIDRLSGITCSDGECVISIGTFYDDLCERLATFSKDNDIDIIVSQNLNRDLSSDIFDEAMEKFSTIELPDDQELILVFKSHVENGSPFVKLYEKRNNMIRNFNIKQYFKKSDVQETKES